MLYITPVEKGDGLTKKPFVTIVALLVACFALCPGTLSPKERKAEPWFGQLHAPAGERPVAIDPSGQTILPNGRLITPRGTQIKVAPHPYGLALSHDGKTLVTVNSGAAPFSLSLITDLDSTHPTVTQIPPGFKSEDADPESVFMGAAISPDDKTVYVSEGNNGCVGMFDMAQHQRVGSVSLDGDFHGTKYGNSLTGELALSPDGRYLYVLDIAHFRLVVVDTAARKIISSVAVGRMPFALALSPDGRHLYVSNVGTFSYALIPGYDPKNPQGTGMDFPPFGYPSKEAEKGVRVGARNIPGLGGPNGDESNSLWTIDVSNPGEPVVTQKIRTGLPIGKDSLSGSSPGGVVAGRNWIFVSNSVQDSLTVIDSLTGKVEKTMLLVPAAAVVGLRGILPFGLAMSPDEARVYVACAGINAVAVLDAQHLHVLGYIPTAWFPARVQVSRDGTMLYVANAKGFGAGPNGGPNFHPGPEGSYIGDITKGVVSIIPIPDKGTLRIATNEVQRDNGFISGLTVNVRDLAKPAKIDSPIPATDQASKYIHHIIFVVKENRTFDQVFGDLESEGAERINAEPSLAEFGDDAEVPAKGESKKDQPEPEPVHLARVTPNHHALARRFAFSDNFYVDSDVSVDGHHWLVDNYPNELVETGWPAGYGGKLDFKPDPDAPGRLEIGGSTPWPEAYLEAGSLWEHLARHHITFRNYGEGFELPGQDEGPGELPTGVREAVNVPMSEALFENTSRSYPDFNTNISDQFRFHQFQQEFQTRYASGKEPLPQFIYIWLPNDHTADPRPEDGFPYRASYVADNDLALGKLVDLISHSKFWKDTAIFVTEDDAQAGTDHVDAHRSLLMVISPYAKPGVSHVHTSIASILKTFDLILGLPALNQYDAVSTSLADCFSNQPDFTPYDALPSDARIFNPALVKEPGGKLQTGGAHPSEPLDDPARIRRQLREKLQEGQNSNRQE